MIRKNPPEKDILSSFFLADLSRVRGETGQLPTAAAFYLGLRVPQDRWYPLTDRARLAELLRPSLFPLGRWPGPGRHPLTLLQQAAVNAIVRDLAQVGLAAVNGPPGTGKTTLLRDLVAHVMISRAEALAKIDDPRNDPLGLDLMDFAVVVASSNNAAVENVSLELPLRKALAEDFWHDARLDYFARTADHVAGIPADAPEADHAWGLAAARLGNAENRRDFFGRAWWDRDWGLQRWLDVAAFPDNPTEPPSALTKLAPPLRRPEALAAWLEARDLFRHAHERCRRLRSELDEAHAAMAKLREVEAKLPVAEEAVRMATADLESATRAMATATRAAEGCRAQEEIEAAKLKAIHALAPSFLARLFRTAAWRAHVAEVRTQLTLFHEAERARKDADARYRAAEAEQDRLTKALGRAAQARDRLTAAAADIKLQLDRAVAIAGSAAPGRRFWSQQEDDLQRASPWNGGEFRAARDELFVAAVRLHRAFVALAAKRVKDAVNVVAKSGIGAGSPSPEEWGLLFVLVPVVSTTFASFGRMFASLDAASLGWVLVDEAGQASPQWALGALWRARRAVVIGDPLQIEPVVTTPEKTTRCLFAVSGADFDAWAAPGQSTQTLANRASSIQARFRSVSGTGVRVTGIPLLVHRRCDRPMFDLANQIAYGGQMVFATPPGASAIRDILGPSAWIDVAEPSSGKWVEAEGELIAAALAKLGLELEGPPDLYVICPFREPARRLKSLLAGRGAILPGMERKERQAWLGRSVGTIHTFQGKEAEAVILMLGAGTGAPPGARAWAGQTPNLLNVAATRAKRVLYVVGNRDLWRRADVFAKAASALPVRTPDAWLGPTHRHKPAAYRAARR